MSILEPREVPAQWKVEKIGDLFDYWGGHTPSKAKPEYWGKGVPWISSKDVKSSRLTTTTLTVTSKAVRDTGLRVCPPGSVVVVVRSGILAHSLPVGVTTMPAVINQDLKAFFSKEPFMNEWLALFLRSSAQDLLASSRRDGTTVQSIQVPILLNTSIPVPPREVRRQLIEVIEDIMNKRERIVARLDLVSKQVDRSANAMLAKAFRGELGLNGSNWPKALSGQSHGKII